MSRAHMGVQERQAGGFRLLVMSARLASQRAAGDRFVTRLPNHWKRLSRPLPACPGRVVSGAAVCRSHRNVCQRRGSLRAIVGKRVDGGWRGRQMASIKALALTSVASDVNEKVPAARAEHE
jgi:hypothetical protein